MDAATLRAVVAASVAQCRQAGAQCDAAQLAYAACLLEEQHAWGSSSSSSESLCCGAQQLSDAALAAMADRLTQEVLHPRDGVAGATARVQVALEVAVKQQQAIVEAEVEAHATAASRLAARVASTKAGNLAAAGLPLYQSVFESVVAYVYAAAGLQAVQAAVEDAGGAARAQVAAALESVFPLSSVAFFLTLGSQERLQQLEALAAVSCGICLFNSVTGNAPSPLTLPAATQLLQAQRVLGVIDAAAADAEAALALHNVPPAAAAAAAAGEAAATDGSCSSSGSAPSSGLGAALFCGQAAVALRRLAADLAAGIACCQELHQELERVLAQAAQLAGARAGAPVSKDAVLPLFESAGRLHHALTGELRLLLVRARLWESTCEALASAPAQQPGVPQVLGFKPSRCLTHGGSSTPAHGEAGSAESPELPPGVEFVPQPAGAAAEEQQLALGGMCPVSLAGSVAAGSAAVPAAGAGDSQLMLGAMARTELGALRYEGQLYGFCSPAALAAFAQGPESILGAVRQAAHAVPLLHHMLRLAPAAAAATRGSATASSLRASSAASATARPLSGLPVSAGSGAGSVQAAGSSRAASPVLGAAGGVVVMTRSGTRNAQVWQRPGSAVAATGRRWAMPPLRLLLDVLEAGPLKVDAGTQTVTHVQESHIDVAYEWNEWALRRRILALANLRHKATHSAQTVLSAFRREGTSQTWLPKQAAVQTRVNRGSSVPRQLRYITGLRGSPDCKMGVVSLELDVHGQGASVKQAGRL